MAENKYPEVNLQRARDLLSPYLDGEVTVEERGLVEQVLADSEELRRELETLRRTVVLLASLPPVPAPRPFTLSEADVQGVSRVPRRFFGLPGWASGLAVALATFVCVVAAGGLLLSRQMGGAPAAAPAAEVARAPEMAATEAPAAKEEAAASEAPAAAPTQPAAAQKAAPAEPATQEAARQAAPATEAPAEAAAPAPSAQEEQIAADTATANQAEVPPAPTATAAPALLAAPAQSPAPQAGAAQTGAAPGGMGGGAPQPPQPTPAPLATPAVQVTTEEYGQAAVEGQPGTAESAAATEAPESIGMAQQDAAKERASQPVKISSLKVQVAPGLIQIEGVIPAPPGNPLVATLQRNGEPFDSWADPATLHTVVQPGGRFYLAIQAMPGRPDRDLQTGEPASYQVIVTSGGSNPVTAVVPLDMASLPAEPVATATPLPSPSATAPLALTAVPATPVAAPAAPVVSSPGFGLPNWLVISGLAGLVGLGLMVWFLLRRQK